MAHFHSNKKKKKEKKYKKYLPKRCDLKEDIMTKEDEIKRDPI